jgi:hypothetical protein
MRQRAWRRTFPAVVASCCKPPVVPVARICGNENRPPVARNALRPACHSTYPESPTKSTAQCNRLRNQDGSSTQPVLHSLVIRQFVQQFNQVGITGMRRFYRHQRALRLTLRRRTLTLRKLARNSAWRLEISPVVTSPSLERLTDAYIEARYCAACAPSFDKMPVFLFSYLESTNEH